MFHIHFSHASCHTEPACAAALGERLVSRDRVYRFARASLRFALSAYSCRVFAFMDPQSVCRLPAPPRGRIRIVFALLVLVRVLVRVLPPRRRRAGRAGPVAHTRGSCPPPRFSICRRSALARPRSRLGGQWGPRTRTSAAGALAGRPLGATRRPARVDGGELANSCQEWVMNGSKPGIAVQATAKSHVLVP